MKRSIDNGQVKSRERVIDHGEVFTSEREVNAMLDLVKNETDRIDSRFLEPACGSGNFLIAILERKLGLVAAKYMKSQIDYEKYAFLAVSSIYGVDILWDNIEECKHRLYALFINSYEKLYKSKSDTAYEETIYSLLNTNMVCGDALTMKNAEGNPIVFAEWSFAKGSMVQRRDYTLAQLLEPHDVLLSDEQQIVGVNNPIKEYGLVHYKRIKEL